MIEDHVRHPEEVPHVVGSRGLGAAPERLLDVGVLPQLLEGVYHLLRQLFVAGPGLTDQVGEVGDILRQFAPVRLEPLELDLHQLNQFIRIVGTWLAPPPVGSIEQEHLQLLRKRKVPPLARSIQEMTNVQPYRAAAITSVRNQGQVMNLCTGHVAAARVVVPRSLLSVDDIQENEFGGSDHGPFNSSSRRFQSLSFSDINFLTNPGFASKIINALAPAISCHPFSEGAAKTLTLFCSHGFLIIFQRCSETDRPFNFRRRGNPRSCHCPLGNLRQTIGFLLCPKNEECTVAFTISE
jgi:hypothetical protein